MNTVGISNLHLISHFIHTLYRRLELTNQISWTGQLDWPVGRSLSGSVVGQIGLSLYLVTTVGQVLVNINGRSPHNFITLVAAVGYIWSYLQTVGDVYDRRTGQHL